jgi:hypothetical protein
VSETGLSRSHSLSGLNLARLTSLNLTNPDHRLSAHVATKIVESHRPD